MLCQYSKQYSFHVAVRLQEDIAKAIHRRSESETCNCQLLCKQMEGVATLCMWLSELFQFRSRAKNAEWGKREPEKGSAKAA